MSLGLCDTCQHASVCTYPRDHSVHMCEEYQCAQLCRDCKTKDKADSRERELVGASRS